MIGAFLNMFTTTTYIENKKKLKKDITVLSLALVSPYLPDWLLGLFLREFSVLSSLYVNFLYSSHWYDESWLS